MNKGTEFTALDTSHFPDIRDTDERFINGSNTGALYDMNGDGLLDMVGYNQSVHSMNTGYTGKLTANIVIHLGVEPIGE